METATIEQIGDLVREVADRAGPSVVGLGGRRMSGSGVVVDDGLVLTNAHNVASENPTVVFSGERAEKGRLVGIDENRDLALIQVETAEARPVAWDPENLTLGIGTPVIGLANPGGRGLRATLGLVAAADRAFRGPQGRRVPGGFEHTALAPPGSSGGPVVGTDGSLLGLNTRRLGRGFYLAQAATVELRATVEVLRTGRHVRPKRLGLGLAPAEVAGRLRRTLGLEPVEGLLVRLVEDGSPAHAAGIREGDVVVSADGKPTTDVDHLHSVIDSAGQSIELGLIRVNDRVEATIRFDD